MPNCIASWATTWPKPALPSRGDHGAGVFGHRGVAVELQKTTGVGFDVAGDHPDAVGVMPGKIGGDQMVRDEGGFPGVLPRWVNSETTN